MSRQKENLKSSGTKFEATSLTLHLVYTFLFSSFNIEDKINTSHDETKAREAIAQALEVENDCIVIHWAGKDTREEKKGSYLDPYLHLKLSRIEINHILSDRLEYLEWKKNKYTVTQIRYRLLLLESGQGALEFILDLKRSREELFNIQNIVHLSNLGMYREKVWNHEYDKDIVSSKSKLIKRDGEILLFLMFYKITKALQGTLADFCNRDEENEFKWIDTDQQLKLVGRIDDHASVPHFQDPFPVMELTLSDENYAHTFLDIEQAEILIGKDQSDYSNNWIQNQEKLNKELLTILSRSKVFHYPDVSFASRFGYLINNRLVNMCSTSLIFLHLYSRSGIAIRPQNKMAEDHAEYIVPAFIETVLYLRMRWHTYVAATQWLDKIIENLSKNQTPFKEILKMIIESRRGISRALCDPITYRLGSGSMNKVYESGLDIFRMRDIEKIVSEKSDMIDRLYANLFEQQRIDVSEEISKKYLKVKQI